MLVNRLIIIITDKADQIADYCCVKSIYSIETSRKMEKSEEFHTFVSSKISVNENEQSFSMTGYNLDY